MVLISGLLVCASAKSLFGVLVGKHTHEGVYISFLFIANVLLNRNQLPNLLQFSHCSPPPLPNDLIKLQPYLPKDLCFTYFLLEKKSSTPRSSTQYTFASSLLYYLSSLRYETQHLTTTNQPILALPLVHGQPTPAPAPY